MSYSPTRATLTPARCFPAIPVPQPHARRQRQLLEGDVPSPLSPPAGCHLHPRCAHAIERCRIERPALVDDQSGHATACHRWRELPAMRWIVRARGAHRRGLRAADGASSLGRHDVRAVSDADTLKIGKSGRPSLIAGDKLREGNHEKSFAGPQQRPHVFALTCGLATAQTTLRIGLAEDPDVLDPSLARTYVGRIVFAVVLRQAVRHRRRISMSCRNSRSRIRRLPTARPSRSNCGRASNFTTASPSTPKRRNSRSTVIQR